MDAGRGMHPCACEEILQLKVQNAVAWLYKNK
jgi:hypothetical protein